MTQRKSHILLVGLFVLAACGTNQQIDLTDYAPVIDPKNVDMQKYETDLVECRQIGMKAQERYKKQRGEELAKARAATVIGAVAGAAIGGAIGDSSDAADGAMIGGVLGAGVGAENVDHTRLLAKFGPAALIDRCMVGRGYKLLNREGFGGG